MAAICTGSDTLIKYISITINDIEKASRSIILKILGHDTSSRSSNLITVKTIVIRRYNRNISFYVITFCNFSFVTNFQNTIFLLNLKNLETFSNLVIPNNRFNLEAFYSSRFDVNLNIVHSTCRLILAQLQQVFNHT